MTPISELDKRMNTHDAAWMLYDAERMENERLQAENAALKADLISVGKARQTLMDDNLKLIEDVAKLKEQVAHLDKDYAKRFEQMELETLSLQSKSAALVGASQLAADQIRKCDYTPARSTLLVAIAAMSHKEGGNE